MPTRWSCKPNQRAYVSSDKDLEKRQLCTSPPTNKMSGCENCKKDHPGFGPSEIFSVYDLCAQANAPSFSQGSASFAQNSVSSLFRDSALETVFCQFPIPKWLGRKTEIPRVRNRVALAQNRFQDDAETYCWAILWEPLDCKT